MFTPFTLVALIALLPCESTPLAAQQGPSASLGEVMVHESWTAGLPRKAIRGIIQSRDGYLRLATDGGLARFDGVRFVVNRASATTVDDSLPDEYLNGLTESGDGTIWVATASAGVSAYRDGRFQTYRTAQGLLDRSANFVYEDRDGTIWVGSPSGVVRRVGRGFQRVSGFPSVGANAMAEDADGTPWVATDDGVYRIRDGRVERVDLAPLLAPRVPAILRGRDGTMWIGTVQGLVRMTKGANGGYRVGRVYREKDGLRSSYVMSITEQRDGALWVGTRGGGAARLEGNGRFRSFGRSEGLPDNNVYAVQADREDNVWVGTLGGLSKLRLPALSNWQSNGFWTTSIVWSVDVQPDGSVWVGSGSEGIIHVTPDGSTRQYTTADGLPSDVILTSHRHSDGSIWVGTRNGVARLEGARFKDVTLDLGLARASVRTLFEDSQHRFWVGTDSVLMVESGGRRRVVSRANEPPGSRVYTVVEDSSRQIWVARGPLQKLRGDALVPFVSLQGDSIAQAMDLRPDSSGLWVATYARGLALVRHDSAFFFATEQTGLSNEILQVIDDGRGALWLTSGSGMQRVLKDELLRFLRDPSTRVHVRQFTSTDGLRSHDFCKSGNASGSVAPDGRLWLPTTGGVAIVDPAAIATDVMVPQVFVERVQSDDRMLAAADTVRLPRGTRHVRIEFTSTALAAPLNTRLFYQLSGVDHDWRQAEPSDRSATYEDLPRGRFVFRVRAENADGVPSVEPDSILIISTPPLTRSPWFWAMVSAIAVAIAALGYRLRVGALRERAANLRRLAALFRATLYSIDEAVITTDERGRVTAMNARAEVLTGWSEAEASGRDLGDAFRLEDEETRSPVSLVGLSAPMPEEGQARAATLRPGVLIARGGRERPVSHSAAPITDESGERHGTVVVLRDETERRARQMHEIESRKMESMGRFAGGIAHDFNNLLAVINGAAELAAHTTPAGSEARAELAAISAAGGRAAELTGQLMAFSRRGTLSLVDVDVNAVVMNLQGMLRRLLGGNVQLEVRSAHEASWVHAAPSQLEQIVMNLTLNARDAMPGGGQIVLSVGSEQRSEPTLITSGTLSCGSFVTLTIRDSGSGMDARTSARIFEPFFTTKQAGRGTGLGLATVHRIVLDLGGGIAVESAPGRGTVFTVYLPRVSGRG